MRSIFSKPWCQVAIAKKWKTRNKILFGSSLLCFSSFITVIISFQKYETTCSPVSSCPSNCSVCLKQCIYTHCVEFKLQDRIILISHRLLLFGIIFVILPKGRAINKIHLSKDRIQIILIHMLISDSVNYALQLPKESHTHWPTSLPLSVDHKWQNLNHY